MFAIVNGKVLIAERGDARCHADWLSQICPQFNIYTDTRGYYLDGKIVAYRYDDFLGDEVVERALEEPYYNPLKPLSVMLDLGSDVEVWVGAKPGVTGTVFEPIKRLYTLGDVLEWPTELLGLPQSQS